MNLFYAPGACSLANHIALIEAGLPYSLISVDREKRTQDGRDFLAINPKGYVPALEFDDGTVLTENLAILTYIAERSGRLLAEKGLDRWRALEATAFMTSELHNTFKPLFYPDTSDAQKEKSRATLIRRFATLADQLGEKPFLIGEHMSIADAYLFVMLSWAANFKIDLPKPFESYFNRLKAMPSVAQALKEEGLS